MPEDKKKPGLAPGFFLLDVRVAETVRLQRLSYDDLGAHVGAVVKVDDVLVQHAHAA